MKLGVRNNLSNLKKVNDIRTNKEIVSLSNKMIEDTHLKKM
jgi:hypothetical protein